MSRSLTVSLSKMLVFVVIGLVFLLPLLATAPARADTPTDGRINLIPWVNSWGAVAVYCVDQNGGHGSYTGGRIDVTDADGQVLLRVTEAQINQAGVDPHQAVVIGAGPLYTLSRLPDGAFLLTSKPDAEGKTFIGKWYDCTPVGPASAPAAATEPACYTLPSEQNWGAACPVLCGNNPPSVCGWSEFPYGDFCSEFCDSVE
jgi:hypothetical protein